ncbi:AP-3 complex subunit beta-2, partial [Operophtera brumata]
VVKNVVSKNIEVKKLVYVYLVRYAEEQQDLALLSISTFQRALKDPNQLIRASALRVLSSIRVNMIVPIVMLAIRDSSSDMSPYVRKTAAHAIPKLYSAACSWLCGHGVHRGVSGSDESHTQKLQLALLTVLTVYARSCFPDPNNEVRFVDELLADVDEWGQLAFLTVLTEYSTDSETDKPFYESDSDSAPRTRSSPTVDPDLRLLLRAAKPLLQSRNAGVVTAVAQLYYHCAPAQELPPVAKAMIRLLRAPLEVQSVLLKLEILTNLATEASAAVVLREFQTYVTSNDKVVGSVRGSSGGEASGGGWRGLCQGGRRQGRQASEDRQLLKLEILTNLATEASAAVVLREFQTYVTSNDKVFAAHTIQAIGRLAVAIQTETETCLNGLLHLLSSKDVVGGGAASAKAAVARAAKLLRTDRLAPAARAAAVWLVAEHGAEHPRAAAILAHLATTFPDQKNKNFYSEPESKKKNEKSNLELLLELDEVADTLPTMTPTCGGFLSPPDAGGAPDGEAAISITPPIGELMRAVSMGEARWLTEQKRLRGMTEVKTNKTINF